MNLLHDLFDRAVAGVETQLGSLRCFERRIDTGEVPDQARACTAVQPLGVATLADCQRGIDEYLDESARQQLAHDIAISPKRRNERSQHDQSGVDHQCRDLAHTTNVFLSILLGKTEVTVEPRTQVITIEQVGMSPRRMQASLQRLGEGRLSRTTEAGEPDDARLLSLDRGSLNAIDATATSRQLPIRLHSKYRLRIGTQHLQRDGLLSKLLQHVLDQRVAMVTDEIDEEDIRPLAAA